jgi:acyl carrier protein
MDKEYLKDKIITIVQKETGFDLTRINPESEIRSQINLDSLQLMKIFAAIVEELHIDVPYHILSAKTFNEIIERLYCGFFPR